MKKIFLLILGFVMFKVGYSQYPIQQYIGADSAVVTSKGGLQGRLINQVFVDTTAANSQRIKQYPGAMVYASGKLWVRNTTATGWTELAYGPISTTNIYNSDGSLTGNRQLDGNGYSLAFNSIGGEFGVGADSIALVPSSGKFRVDLNSGLGTKALRYNPVTRLFSYADTTSPQTDSSVVRNQRWKWRDTWEDMSDFEWSTNSKWSAQATGTGAVALETANAPLTTDTTYFVSAQFATGTTATGRAVALLGNASSGIAGIVRSFNTQYAIYEVGSVWIPTLSDTIGGTERYIASFGYIDWWNNANPQDGVQFYYDRSTYGNYWVIRSSENGTATTIVTTTPIVAATKYTLRYEITNWQMASSGASIRAYINDVEIVASSGSYPISTNIPRGGNANKNFYPSVLIEKRAGTTSRNLYVDWVYNYLEFITR